MSTDVAVESISLGRVSRVLTVTDQEGTNNQEPYETVRDMLSISLTTNGVDQPCSPWHQQGRAVIHHGQLRAWEQPRRGDCQICFWKFLVLTIGLAMLQTKSARQLTLSLGNDATVVSSAS